MNRQNHYAHLSYCVTIALGVALLTPAIARADWATSNPKGWMLFDVIFVLVMSGRDLLIFVPAALVLRVVCGSLFLGERVHKFPTYRYQASAHVFVWLITWLLILPALYLAPYQNCGGLMWAGVHGSQIAPIVYLVWAHRRATRAAKQQRLTKDEDNRGS